MDDETTHSLLKAIQPQIKEKLAEEQTEANIRRAAELSGTGNTPNKDPRSITPGQGQHVFHSSDFKYKDSAAEGSDDA